MAPSASVQRKVNPNFGARLLGRGWRALRSRRLAIALLMGLGVLALLGTVLPQQERVGPVAYQQWVQANPGTADLMRLLSLDSLYSAWWFLALFALLYANTLACTLPQLRSAFLRTVRQHSPAPLDLSPAASSTHGVAVFPIPTTVATGTVLVRAAEVLRRRRYHVAPPGELSPMRGRRLVGRKGTLAVWGSPLFHLGLVVVLTGAAAGGLLRFSGYLEIADGQQFVESKLSYLQQSQGPLFDHSLTFGPVALTAEGHRGFTVRMDRLTATTSSWREGVPSDVASQVTLLEEGREVRHADLRINEPLEHRGIKLYQSGMFGLAPIFQLELPDGRGSTGAVYLSRQGHDRYENSLYLPGTSYHMTVRAREGDQGVEVEIFERKFSLWSGRLEPGQAAQFDQVSLKLEDLRRWTGLRVVADPGMIPVYLGFGLVLLGLAISVLVLRREVWVVVAESSEGRVVQVGGRAPRLKALFAAELQEMAEALREHLDGKAGPKAAPVGGALSVEAEAWIL